MLKKGKKGKEIRTLNERMTIGERIIVIENVNMTNRGKPARKITGNTDERTQVRVASQEAIERRRTLTAPKRTTEVIDEDQKKGRSVKVRIDRQQNQGVEMTGVKKKEVEITEQKKKEWKKIRRIGRSEKRTRVILNENT